MVIKVYLFICFLGMKDGFFLTNFKANYAIKGKEITFATQVVNSKGIHFTKEKTRKLSNNEMHNNVDKVIAICKDKAAILGINEMHLTSTSRTRTCVCAYSHIGHPRDTCDLE